MPIVSNGFMWNNLVDRAWLFGGKPLDEDELLANDIWRVSVDADTDDGIPQWTRLGAGDNATQSRPSRGAECNVPELQRGYYLGGMIDEGRDQGNKASYTHSLAMFDMELETVSSIPVLDFVPVVNQSLVFLNTATRSGALVALGGYVEKDGELKIVSELFVYRVPLTDDPFEGFHDIGLHFRHSFPRMDRTSGH